jgi:hypothetical protein
MARHALDELTVGEPLRRREDHLRASRLERRIRLPQFIRPDGTVELHGFDTEIAQAFTLVLHQGDERRDHQRRARQQRRRKLVAQRFAGAGRHDGDGVLAGEHTPDHGVLTFAQLAKAEDLPKRLLDGVFRGGARGWGHRARLRVRQSLRQ